MNLKNILHLIYNVSIINGTSKPLIVGGAVRDKIAGNLYRDLNDIDITNGDNSIFILAKEFGIKLAKYTPCLTKQSQDGHFSVYTSNLKIDFSSNFNVPNIKEILKNKLCPCYADVKQESK
jgi:hypothetical protein